MHQMKTLRKATSTSWSNAPVCSSRYCLRLSYRRKWSQRPHRPANLVLADALSYGRVRAQSIEDSVLSAFQIAHLFIHVMTLATNTEMKIGSWESIHRDVSIAIGMLLPMK